MRTCMPRASIALCLGLLAPLVSRAEVSRPSELLPPSTLVYAEITDPPAFVASLLDHPLRQEIEKLPQVLELRKNPGFQQFQLGLRLVELKLGEHWRPALKRLSGGGITIAVDGPTQGVVLFVHADDPDFLQKAASVLVELAAGEADKDDRPPVEEVSYRGIDGHRIGEAAFAVIEQWLIATNNLELGKAVLDRYLGDDLPSLAGVEPFQAAGDVSEESVWAYVNLKAIQGSGAAEDLFRGQAEDFGGELILGGILAAIKEAPSARANLAVAEEGLKLSHSIPDANEAAREREYFFGPGGRGAAPPTVHVDRQIASIRAYRDVGGLWLRGPELFDEQVNAQMARTESDLSTLFGGHRFGEEILAAAEPQFQILAARQDYGQTPLAEPAIKIPAFAVLMQLKDPAQTRRPLKIAYQTAVGFGNIAAGQQGYPPLELDIDKRGDAEMISATYAPEETPAQTEDENAGPASPAGRLQNNFSPTIAFVDEHFVISSTKELAAELLDRLAERPVEQAAEGQGGSQEAAVNTAIQLAVPEVHEALAANREHLVNQNMVQKGHEREAAEREIDGLLTILGWLDRASLELVQGNDELRLQASIGIKARETTDESAP